MVELISLSLMLLCAAGGFVQQVQVGDGRETA
jgi:hypothetical protein